MGQKDDCIFCKIVKGQIPCVKVFEDEKALAFMDIAPLNQGHILVIPKNHYETILDIESESYGWLAKITSKISVAIQKSVNPDGINIMQLNGKAANQVVPHLHIHIVPRNYGDGLSICAWEPAPGPMDQIKATAEAIKAYL
ncbi:MAG: HIT family protein [Deltaproteobacteria bacterium]|nr:HIT family protein [Deltaproteobacteria bacterium]